MPEISHSLRAATQSLRRQLEWVKSANVEDPEAAVRRLMQMTGQLTETGHLLRQAQLGSANGEVDRSISEYRDCLHRLQEALPILQSRLLAARSGMEPEHARVRAAADWAQCAKSTLR